MPPRRPFALLAAALLAAASLPAADVTLSLAGPPSFETSAPAADIEGLASAPAGLARIFWTDLAGHSGLASWSSNPASPHAHWRISSIPLRPGWNSITVTAVDAANNAASLSLAVKSSAPPAPPAEIRTGLWRGRSVTFLLRNGMAVVDGDIVLAPARALESAASSASSLPSSSLARRPTPLTDGFALDYTFQLWPLVNGIRQIPYTIQNGASNLTTAIAQFNASLSGIVELVPQSSETNYVTFNIDPSFPNGEGQSSVGMVGGQQFLTCSPSCTVATLLHEMGHTTGLLHEHQRPDRDTYVVFNQSNADLPNVAGNLDIPQFNNQVVGLYDYASLMHYPAFAFSKAGLPVLESIPAGIPLSNNNGYTPGDIDQIARLYGLTPSTVTVATNPPGLKVIVDGATLTAPQTFSWPLNSKHTLNIPNGAQSIGDGSLYVYGRWNDNTARSHPVKIFGGTGVLTSPASLPAYTVYQANFVKLDPFAISVYPPSAGSVTPTPAPVSEFGGAYYTDRQLVSLAASASSGENFYDWFHLPYPASDNPKQFLIQAPATNAQAVFVSTPVTTIGESLTGPNTWNPGLAASVDGAFTPLPAGFSSTYDGPSWNPGTTHTIAADSSQSPVTTNVRYSFNSWTDGGAQSHSITQPSSGTQSISASFTPVYRTYAIENPGYCGEQVQFSPLSPTGDGFYPDGTQLTLTAIPNSAFPSMNFAAWSGSLTGSQNPQSFTLHDQLAATANFNTASSPIAITAFRPVSAVANSKALNLTLLGTGFTSSTSTYWNSLTSSSSYRPNTYVSPTQIVMHLSAGDLATPGGQDVFAGNYVNTSSASCGAGYEATFDVKTSIAASALLRIAKTHSGNFTQGEAGAKYTLLVTNSVNSQPTSGEVLVNEVVPSGLTLVSMAGTGWTCSSASCNRSDVLQPGHNYPTITVTVNVSPTAPATVTNAAIVAGGGSPPSAAKDPTTIVP